MPTVAFFTEETLQQELTDAGFEIDHRWRPDDGATVFLVAHGD